uniref:Phospholipid/glycerol acyltransferase domain-containing protein n=2 Tax=Pavo cristatus TaxID=9049 RepID=A0A8C9LCD6_PAVCR
MEELGSLAVSLGTAWLSLVFVLIVLPSALGVSLGISEAYMWVLVKTLEWATIRIEKGVKKPQPQMLKIPAANGKNLEYDHFCRQGFFGNSWEVEPCRACTCEKGSCNLKQLGASSLPVYLNLETYPMCPAAFQHASDACVFSFSLKNYLSEVVHLTCSRILVRALSGTIHYHNKENKPQKGGICVANHTSPIDAIILTNDGCYAMVGQVHGGLMGVIQRATVKACPHVWFERSEIKDRHLVTKRLREHVADKNKLPILIFPEGTCINNTSVMMFKKGSFEIGGTIYPVAIKYDPQFGDAFWNSSKYNIVSYLLRIMTSWAIVCHVWYMPPMVRKEGEDAVQFANRVRSAIAHQGGLTELPWDGGLKRAKVKDSFKEEQQKNYSKMLVRNGSQASLSAGTESD